MDKSFNPDAAAKPLPTTKPQIFAFDQLITEKSSESDRSKEEDDEEEEIFEYRLNADPIRFFRTHYPTENNVKTPNYPLLAGPEVRTCDHRYYTKQKHDESKRLGVVIPVPFYSNDGSLKGMISAVILSTSVEKFFLILTTRYLAAGMALPLIRQARRLQQAFLLSLITRAHETAFTSNHYPLT